MLQKVTQPEKSDPDKYIKKKTKYLYITIYYIKTDFIGTLLAIYGAYDGEFPQNKNNPAFRLDIQENVMNALQNHGRSGRHRSGIRFRFPCLARGHHGGMMAGYAGNYGAGYHYNTAYQSLTPEKQAAVDKLIQEHVAEVTPCGPSFRPNGWN